MECVNKYIPGWTKKQYYIDNKDQLIEKQNLYNENHKDEKKQYDDNRKEQKKEEDKKRYQAKKQAKLNIA